MDLRQADQLEIFLDDHNSIPASCVVYRRSCHERYGYWREDLPRGADWAYWREILRPSRGANLAYVTPSTALHFRATWKTGKTWGPAPLALWLEAARKGWWPRALRVDVGAGVLPQAAVAGGVARDPTSWTSEMRSGIQEVMEYLASSGGLELRQLRKILGPDPAARLAAIEKRLTNAEDGRRDAEARAAEARAAEAATQAAEAAGRAETPGQHLTALVPEVRLVIDSVPTVAAGRRELQQRVRVESTPPRRPRGVQMRLRAIAKNLLLPLHRDD